jgi:hypothetical protein
MGMRVRSFHGTVREGDSGACITRLAQNPHGCPAGQARLAAKEGHLFLGSGASGTGPENVNSPPRRECCSRRGGLPNWGDATGTWWRPDRCHLSGLSGERPVIGPEPPRTVGAEIPSAYRVRRSGVGGVSTVHLLELKPMKDSRTPLPSLLPRRWWRQGSSRFLSGPCFVESLGRSGVSNLVP